MSRQVCKAKQVPRIFQRRNQTIRSIVRNVWCTPEGLNVEGVNNIANIQASSECNFIVDSRDTVDRHDSSQVPKTNKPHEKYTSVNVDCTTKLFNASATIGDVVSSGDPLLEKSSSDAVDDIEKWLKTRSESVSIMDLDAIKSVVEAGIDGGGDGDRSMVVDCYLDNDSPHAFLGKDPDGLSIDIDLSDKKLNLDYDPLLRELQSDKLLEACQKNDDFTMPEFRLDHLDPLVLSPHDMMVAGEILPSASDRAGSPMIAEPVENLRVAKREKDDSGDSEAGERADKPVQVEYGTAGGAKESGVDVTNPGALSSGQQIIEAPILPNDDASSNVEYSLRAKCKSEPKIIKKRRKIRPKKDKNEITFLREPCRIDGKDSVMAVVAISTDKISNMTQIVINTGTDEQIYQGKTSELIEATGNFPKIAKIDLENGSFGTRDRPHERTVSKALEELGITDESLEPALVNENGRTWLCPRDECNREFCKLHALKAHLLAHFGIRPFKCDYEGCTWAFHSEFKLKRHKETHLKHKNFACVVAGCNRRFTTVYNLWSHEKLHTRPNRILCQVPDCHEKFQTKRALELHMKNHDERHAPYICSHEGCGKRYYTNNALTSHQRCHNYKEIDVKCSWPDCGKIFDKPCRLKAHVRSHTGSKPYTCNYQDCQWAFSSSSKLKRHQKKHTNERKFACNVEACGKAFMRSEHLKEHLLTHAGGGYFQCHMCNAHFSAKSSLYVHIKKHQIKDAVSTITDSAAAAKVTQRRNRASRETREDYSMGIVGPDSSSMRNGSIECTANPRTNETDHVSRDSAKTERDNLTYSCGMEGCGKSFESLPNLASHMIAIHEGSLLENDASPIGITSVAEASDLDYILYATATTNSKGMCRTMLLESCDAVIMSESSTENVACLPEPEPPPIPASSSSPSASSSPPSQRSVEANSRFSENSYYRTCGDKQTSNNQMRIRKACQGSARTGLTCEDVWKLKAKINGVPEAANVVVGATDVVLSEANLNESLLLTEELSSMYYQDDIVGTECQILLLDSANSQNQIDLRGLE